MISAVNKQYVYRLFIVALIGIKFCMYADTNMTIPGAKFPKHWFKNQYKTTKKPDLHIILGPSVAVCEKTSGLRSGPDVTRRHYIFNFMLQMNKRIFSQIENNIIEHGHILGVYFLRRIIYYST